MRLLALAVSVALAACSNGSRPPTAGSGSQGSGGSAAVAPVAPLVADEASLAASAGKLVEVRGTADNAKLGAEVTVGRTPVYCTGLDRWPADVAGTTVTARGTLEQTDEFSEESDPALPSAGTRGAVWVLRSCALAK